MSKIIGVTVGTPLSPQIVKEKLKKDGFYPVISVSDIEDGHRITITDTNGTKTVDVMDGKDGYTPVKGKDYIDGKDGEDYILTEADKVEIAEQAAQMVEAPDVDLSGYAKTEDIPTKPEDIGAQPKGDYALRSEIPSIPVKSVNGKTGAVVLSASDVNARPATWMPSAADVGARPSTWTPTYSDVGADKSGTASSAISTHNTKTDSHNDIRLMITALTTRLDVLANSDDDTLDQMAEVVAYIKANRDLIDQITTGKVSVTDIVNNLTTNVSNKPLSASQGVALKALIDAITIPTKVSQLTNDAGYLTQHQDISGKLDASALPTAINTALAQAKASGEFDGKNGLTPEKGVDYYTEADKEEIVQQVITALGTPVFGRVDADNNIILTGELADGTYTLKYEDAEGNVQQIGTIEVGAEELVNWLPISVGVDGSIYNSNNTPGYKANARYSASSGAEIDHAGCFITGYIAVKKDQILKVANMTMDKAAPDGNKCFGYLFDTDKKNAKKIQVASGGAYTFDGLGAVWNDNGYLTQLTIPEDGFIRLQASYIGSDSVVTLE